jgi:hypothetical protein
VHLEDWSWQHQIKGESQLSQEGLYLK